MKIVNTGNVFRSVMVSAAASVGAVLFATPPPGAGRSMAGIGVSTSFSHANAAAISNANSHAAFDSGTATANANATSNPSGVETIGMWQNRFQAQTASGGNGVTPTRAGDQASLGVSTITAANFDSRNQVRFDVHRQIATDNHTLAEARDNAAKLDPLARAQLNADLTAVHTDQLRLEKDLKAAAQSTAGSWDSVRTSLAADYSAYASAVIKAQADLSATSGTSASPSAVAKLQITTTGLTEIALHSRYRHRTSRSRLRLVLLSSSRHPSGPVEQSGDDGGSGRLLSADR